MRTAEQVTGSLASRGISVGGGSAGGIPAPPPPPAPAARGPASAVSRPRRSPQPEPARADRPHSWRARRWTGRSCRRRSRPAQIGTVVWARSMSQPTPTIRPSPERRRRPLPVRDERYGPRGSRGGRRAGRPVCKTGDVAAGAASRARPTHSPGAASRARRLTSADEACDHGRTTPSPRMHAPVDSMAPAGRRAPDVRGPTSLPFGASWSTGPVEGTVVRAARLSAAGSALRVGQLSEWTKLLHGRAHVSRPPSWTSWPSRADA
jgi:hypothetical protein